MEMIPAATTFSLKLVVEWGGSSRFPAADAGSLKNTT